ncbi:MAG: helix-turn-helix transcriptional regulator [Paraglaciecola sp.]|nr:helix-turn-helix transcriptional regulator [Paraglaciecola sp.]
MSSDHIDNEANKDGQSSTRLAWKREEDAHVISGKLGKRIKEFRDQNSMSIAAASKLTGVPGATFSRIENNKMSPTFPILLKIMSGLRLTWQNLMEPDRENRKQNIISISQPNEAPMTSIQGYSYHVPHLSSSQSEFMQPLIMDVKAADIKSAGGLKAHDGNEFCYVLKGTLILHFEGQDPVEMQQGSSAMFSGEIPHAYVTKARHKTQVLNIVVKDPILNMNIEKDAFPIRS